MSIYLASKCKHHYLIILVFIMFVLFPERLQNITCHVLCDVVDDVTLVIQINNINISGLYGLTRLFIMLLFITYPHPKKAFKIFHTKSIKPAMSACKQGTACGLGISLVSVQTTAWSATWRSLITAASTVERQWHRKSLRARIPQPPLLAS